MVLLIFPTSTTAREIAAEIQGFTVIAVKSTAPVGTNDLADEIICRLRPESDFAVVSNPEFLHKGAAMEAAACRCRIPSSESKGKKRRRRETSRERSSPHRGGSGFSPRGPLFLRF